MNYGLIYVNSNENSRATDDSFEQMKIHAKEYDYKGFYAVDENSILANAFGAITTPHVFFFGKDERLLYQGAIGDNSIDKNGLKEKYLINAFFNYFAGNEIAPNQTTAVGSIINRK